MLRWILALAWFGTFTVLLAAQPGIDRTKDDKKEPLGDLNAGRSLPKGTIARLGSPRLRSRSDYSHGVQFSPNGKLLVLAASRDDLWWFDLETGKTLYQAEYPVGGIQCGRLLDDGSLLFFHSKSESDNSRHFLTRFDPKSAKIVSEIKIEVAAVDHSEFDRAGARLVVQRDKSLAVFDIKTGGKVWAETLETKPTASPTFFPDGSKVAVAFSWHMQTFDAKTGQRLVKFDELMQHFSGFVASADGRWIAASQSQQFVIIWDANTGRRHQKIPEQKQPIAFSPDSRYLFTVMPDGSVGEWNCATGKRKRNFSIPVADRACLSPDGKRIASRVHDSVTLHDIPAEGEPKLSSLSAELPGLPDDLHFASDGALVGRLTEWGGWAVWSNREPTAALIRPPGSDTIIGLCAGRHRVLTATQKEFVISNLEGAGPAKFKFELSKSGMQRLAALSGDGRVAVAVHEEGLARYDMDTRLEQVIRSGHAKRGAGNIAAVSADGRLAATEGYDTASAAGHVELFSLGNNRPLREFALRGSTDRIAFTPDGRCLAIAFISSIRDGDLKKNLIVVEPESGRELLRLGPMSNGSGPRLALSPDGRTAAWAVENEVRIYELVTGQVRSKLPTPNNDVHSLALAGDGRTLAVAGPGWPVILWDLAGDAIPESPTDWDASWRELAGPDAGIAYKAARRMQRTPAVAVEFLRGKLKPAAPPEPAALAKALASLDAPAFADRQKSSKDLRAWGELAQPELARVLEATESAEVRERIEALLKLVNRPTPEAIRATRAVELLEWMNTPDAKTLVTALAAGAEGALQTREAVAARARMK